jgi:hypothetical protein
MTSARAVYRISYPVCGPRVYGVTKMIVNVSDYVSYSTPETIEDMELKIISLINAGEPPDANTILLTFMQMLHVMKNMKKDIDKGMIEG